MGQNSVISTSTFVIGIIIAIIASVAASSLVGQQLGLTGPQGSTVPQEEQGLPGEQGIQGLVGPQGPSGCTIIVFNDIGSVSDIPITPQNLASVNLYAPTDGNVILTATTTVVTFGDDTERVFGLETTAGDTDLHETRVGVLNGTGSQRREFSSTSIAIVPVTAGKQTFYATAYKPSVFSSQLINLGNVYLTAIFYDS